MLGVGMVDALVEHPPVLVVAHGDAGVSEDRCTSTCHESHDGRKRHERIDDEGFEFFDQVLGIDIGRGRQSRNRDRLFVIHDRFRAASKR